jgi:hypothetical protein
MNSFERYLLKNRIEHGADSLDLINSKTRKAYNLVAQKYHDLFHNEMDEKEYDRNLLDTFAKKFTRDSLICDAGCGPSGHIGRYIFDKGLHVVGIDISDKCVELARRYNPGMATYVLSRSRAGTRDKYSHFVGGDIVDFIRKLQSDSGKDIWLVGGEVIREFLQTQLVDEIILSIHPIILGSGIPPIRATTTRDSLEPGELLIIQEWSGADPLSKDVRPLEAVEWSRGFTSQSRL